MTVERYLSRCCPDSHTQFHAGYFDSPHLYLSGTFSSCQHGANSHFFRLYSTFGQMHQNVVTLGGVCVCFSKSVRKGHFRNVWVGGARWSQFCVQSCKQEETQGTGKAPRITHYSESDSLSSLPLSTRETCRQYSMQTWGVLNSPFRGLSEPHIPHIPPPFGTLSGHKRGNNHGDP